MICTTNHIILHNSIKSQERNLNNFDQIYNSDSDQSIDIQCDNNQTLKKNSPKRSKRIYSHVTTDEGLSDQNNDYLIHITKIMNQTNSNNNHLQQAISKLDEEKKYVLNNIIKNAKHMRYNILTYQNNDLYNNKHIHLFFIKNICFQLSKINMFPQKQQIIDLITQFIKIDLWKSKNTDIIQLINNFDEYLLYAYPELLSQITEKSNDIEGINQLFKKYNQKNDITYKQNQFMYWIRLYYKKMIPNIDIKYINNRSDINEHKVISHMKINQLFNTILILKNKKYNRIQYIN